MSQHFSKCEHEMSHCRIVAMSQFERFSKFYPIYFFFLNKITYLCRQDYEYYHNNRKINNKIWQKRKRIRPR